MKDVQPHCFLDNLLSCDRSLTAPTSCRTPVTSYPTWSNILRRRIIRGRTSTPSTSEWCYVRRTTVPNVDALHTDMIVNNYAGVPSLFDMSVVDSGKHHHDVMVAPATQCCYTCSPRRPLFHGEVTEHPFMVYPYCPSPHSSVGTGVCERAMGKCTSCLQFQRISTAFVEAGIVLLSWAV